MSAAVCLCVFTERTFPLSGCLYFYWAVNFGALSEGVDILGGAVILDSRVERGLSIC